jgi:hypothetical protein
MLSFDHVIYGTRDMDEAARRWREEFGLDSYAGGRHPGQGTGNRIVPLGADYLELMGIVDPDEASSSAIGGWLGSTIAGGDRLFGWCLRTDDIDEVSRRLGLDPIEWTRERPDGEVLRWRLAGLERSLVEPSLPFFIQWGVPDERLPGRSNADHRITVDGIAWIEVAGDAAAIADSLGGADLDVRVTSGGAPGVSSVAVNTAAGELVIT